MEEYIEKAIEIIMDEKGYYWCMGCNEWKKEEDRTFHQDCIG